MGERLPFSSGASWGTQSSQIEHPEPSRIAVPDHSSKVGDADALSLEGCTRDHDDIRGGQIAKNRGPQLRLEKAEVVNLNS